MVNGRLSLADRLEDLAGLLEPTAREVALAEAAAAGARLTLEKAEDGLAALLDPAPQEAAQAEAAVVNGRLTLERAEDGLAALLEPAPQEVAQAEAAVVGSRLSVQNAQEALDMARSGTSADDVAKAQSQVDLAASALANAGRDRELVSIEWQARVRGAQEVFDAGFEGYEGALEKWLGITISQEDAALDPDAFLDASNIDLATIFDPALRFQDISRGFFAEGPPTDDPATRWDEVIVYTWLTFFPAKVAATCEDASLDPQTLCVKREIDTAWDVYREALDDLDAVRIQEAKAITNGEDSISRAQESLAEKQASLDDLKASTDALEIENKEKQLALALVTLEAVEEELAKLVDEPDVLQVESKRKEIALARADLDEAEEDLAKLADEPNTLQVESKRKEIAVARADLDENEVNLAELTNGADPLELEAIQRQLAVSEASLAQAEEDLAELKSSVDPLEVILREAELATAQAALEAAVLRLDGSTLRAPWEGIVSLVNIEAGQAVNPNTPILEIVDPTVVEVDGIVDEIDVLFIRKEARAEVTMDALPGQVLEGTVSDIASSARTQQGVVSYPISIRVQTPRGVQLPEGLSAVASVVIREDRDVLLIPLQALHGSFEQPVVRVMFNGRVEDRPVVLGNSDDFWVAVREGLVVGDQVVMETIQATTLQFGFGGGVRQFQRQFQGAGPGGGGGFGGGGQRQPAQPR